MSDSTEISRVDDPRFPDAKQKLERAKSVAVDKEKDEQIAKILVCGDFGGMARHVMIEVDDDGVETKEVVELPCAAPSSFGIPGTRAGVTAGLCWKHRPEKLAKADEQKARFIETYIKNPELGISHACETSGVNRMNVYWWSDHDPSFRESFQAIKELASAILTDQIEEMVHQAILEWKPGAATIAQWYLVNRRGYAWKPTGKAADQPAVGPTFQGGKHVHVWKMGDQTLTFE